MDSREALIAGPAVFAALQAGMAVIASQWQTLRWKGRECSDPMAELRRRQSQFEVFA